MAVVVAEEVMMYLLQMVDPEVQVVDQVEVFHQELQVVQETHLQLVPHKVLMVE